MLPLGKVLGMWRYPLPFHLLACRFHFYTCWKRTIVQLLDLGISETLSVVRNEILAVIALILPAKMPIPILTAWGFSGYWR